MKWRIVMELIGNLNITENDVITITGGGGKTSLMFEISKELAAREVHHVMTTTAKICIADVPEQQCLIREKLAEKDRESEEQGVYPVLPNVVEKDIPSMLRKRIPGAAGANEAFPGFYGVKVVRPGENLWNIHYNILREYFARRGVNLPRHADEPQPDGRSSSVGRILKFLEGAVQVYSIPENRLVRDLDRIHPDDLIVFFNISDVFSVLDNLQPEELRWIRYIAGRLQLERPEGSRELITRKDLFPRNEPPIPESRIPVEEHR